MKNIEEHALNQLLEIIAPAPALRIAHFTNGGEALVAKLSHFCIENNYEYQLNITSPSFFKTIQKTYKEHPFIQSLAFNLNRPRYMIQGKVYDYLFVTSPIEEHIQSSFLQKAHGIIKNAGLIILFIPKGDTQQRYTWMRLFEEHYFVASSTIDDLFEHYDILISKKMHGWGG